MERAKTAGVTTLYLETAPPELLRLADEIGMTVIESGRRSLPAAEREEELRAIVDRDAHHPCIIGWSIGNLGSEFAKSLRQLDASRFILTGTGSTTKIWAPGRSTPDTGPLPEGLLPVSQ